MKKKLSIYQSTSLLNVGAADRVIRIANAAIDARGIFRIALAGGSTPRGLYEVLSGEEYLNKTDWSRWQIYFSDERVVSFEDSRSNYLMAMSSLLSKVNLKNEQIIIPSVELDDSTQIAQSYETSIRNAFSIDVGEIPQFDLILLGIGSDGHTASLFPGKDALNVVNRLVIDSTPGILPPPVDRVTFTLPLINASHHVIFLASGADKKDAFKAAYFGTPLDSIETVPAYLVRPDNGTLEWFVTDDLTD